MIELKLCDSCKNKHKLSDLITFDKKYEICSKCDLEPTYILFENIKNNQKNGTI